MLLLGPLEVRDGSSPVSLGGRKPRALLARLALDANRTVPVDRLIEERDREWLGNGEEESSLDQRFEKRYREDARLWQPEA